MKPGALATDMHVCPQFTGPIPHVGGPIIPAAPTPTQAETLQAARLADYAFCMEPQDVVFQGASTVLRLTYRGFTKPTATGFAPGTHAFLDRLDAHLLGAPLPDWTQRFEELRPLYPAWAPE